MARTFIRQVTQIRNSDSYDDTLSAGSTLESAPVSIEGDLNSLRSQMKRAIYADSAGDWYADIPTVNSKKRAISALNSDLDDIEEKRILFRADKLTDIVVPSGVAASGTITTVAGASLVDTETFTLNDGVNAATVFEFDSGGGVTGGNIAVAFTGGDTADQVRDAIISAVNGVGATLLITASSGGAATVNLVNDRQGTNGNRTITETVANGGFVVSGMSGGAGDLVVLSVASSQTPSETAAAGAGTAIGAVVSVLSTDVGLHSLVEVSGPNALAPKNLCVVRNASNGDDILSSTRRVYALIQAESGVVDGDAFSDTTKQAQLAFVRPNSTFDDLEAVPGADIAGFTINYSYVRRINFDAIPESAFLSGNFVDAAAATAVTLDNAIDNQVGAATQTQDIDWRISDTYTLDFQDSTGAANLYRIMPNAGNDEVEWNVDTFDVNNVNDADFSNGAIFDSSGTPIRVGSTAGYIDTASADLGLRAGGELYLDDSNQTGSTWAQTAGIKLSDTTAEWDAFELAFGEVSLLKAITNGRRRDKVYANITSSTSADTDVGGVGGGANLDAQLPDLSIGSFLVDYDVLLNGELLRPGANSGSNNDYYPGTSLANGQLRFEFTMNQNDVLCVIPYIRS